MGLNRLDLPDQASHDQSVFQEFSEIIAGSFKFLSDLTPNFSSPDFDFGRVRVPGRDVTLDLLTVPRQLYPDRLRHQDSG